MRIGELAERTGCSTRALRYYENQGLVTAGRHGNGYRDFDDEAVCAVLRIRALLAAGLSSDIVGRVLPCARGAAPRIEPCDEVVAILRAEIDRMDAVAADLARSRELLASILDDSGIPELQ